MEVMQEACLITQKSETAIFEGNEVEACAVLRIMANKCCVVGCSKRGGRDDGVRFYSFPRIIENQRGRTKELYIFRMAVAEVKTPPFTRGKNS